MDHFSIVISLCLTGCISQGVLGSYSMGNIKNRKSAQRANAGFSDPLTVGVVFVLSLGFNEILKTFVLSVRGLKENG